MAKNKLLFTELDKARFWSKVKDTGYCWEWGGQTNNCGYGIFKLGGRPLTASRCSYHIIHGSIPEGLHVLHICDNPKCVNPTHLFTGTHLDNMRDMMKKGRNKKLGRSSKYFGVTYRKRAKKWGAFICKNSTTIALGYFKNEEAAARRRDVEVIKQKIDAPLNFPTPPVKPVK